MKRICVFLAVLTLPALLFAAGGGQQQSASGGYLRFAWWGNAVRDERTIKATQLFMEKNPGVTVETEPTNWDNYWQKLNTQAAAGSLPDVMQQDVSYIKQYNDRNQLVDLNIYSQRGLLDLSQWADSGLSPGRLNGKVVGLILGTNAPGIGVDPAVLQRAGVTVDDKTWTWADVERIALQIYQRTGVQTGDMVNPITIEHICRQFGNGYYAADDKSVGWTNNPQAAAAIKGLFEMDARLAAAGALYDPGDGFIQGRSMEEGPFATGKIWNSLHWSNQHIGQQTAAKRPLEYWMVPTVAGNKAPFGTYFRASMYISMLESSKDKDLAAKFINFFVNDLDGNRILLAERGVPIPTNVRNDLYALVDANNKYLFDYITKVTPFVSPTDPPYPARAGESEDARRAIHLQMLLGRVPIDTGFAQFTQASNAVLSR
jgi:multiple sugar transport system substrate-binding protein